MVNGRTPILIKNSLKKLSPVTGTKFLKGKRDVSYLECTKRVDSYRVYYAKQQTVKYYEYRELLQFLQ